jgi:hypothetical protein
MVGGKGAGRLKLRGKKYRRLSCGCCSIENRKDEYFTALIKKDLHLAKRTFG